MSADITGPETHDTGNLSDDNNNSPNFEEGVLIRSGRRLRQELERKVRRLQAEATALRSESFEYRANVNSDYLSEIEIDLIDGALQYLRAEEDREAGYALLRREPTSEKMVFKALNDDAVKEDTRTYVLEYKIE